MHLYGRKKHMALGVCFIQKVIQDATLNNTGSRITDIGTKALPRIPFEYITDQLLGDNQDADK